MSQRFLEFYPTFLVDVKGVTPGTAELVFGVNFAGSIVVQPLTGMGRDRFGVRNTLTIQLGVHFLGFVALHFADGLIALVVVTVYISGRGGTSAVTNNFLSQAMSGEVKNSGLELLRTCWFLLVATSPLVVGYIAKSGCFEEAFLLLAWVSDIAVIQAVFVSER